MSKYPTIIKDENPYEFTSETCPNLLINKRQLDINQGQKNEEIINNIYDKYKRN